MTMNGNLLTSDHNDAAPTLRREYGIFNIIQPVLWVVFLLSLTLFADAHAESTKEDVVLSVVGWDVYADPEHQDKTIGYASFEKQYGVRIEFTPLSNLDSIIDAAESEKNYDVFIISNEGIKSLYEMGLVQPLNLNQMSHYPELHHKLKYSEWSQFNGKVYSVPWAWGPTGLLYDTTAMSEPVSWNVLWDPKYKGQVSLWDDVSMVWITALSLGYTNVYNLTKTQLAEVRKKLLKLNPQVSAYYSGEQEMNKLIQKKSVVLLNSWFDPSARLRKLGHNFKMVIPKEGAVGMFDSYLISRNTSRTTLAYQYINHQISPTVQARMVEVTGLPPSNIKTLDLLNSADISALHLDEADYFDRMILWDIMPRKHLYDKILQDTKAMHSAGKIIKK